VLFGCMAAALFLIDTTWTIDVLRAVGESSKSMVDGLAQISAAIPKWSPYPATGFDSPLYISPFKIAGVTVDDIIHFGVYHQKFVVGKSGGGDFSDTWAESTSTAIVPIRRFIERFSLSRCAGAADRSASRSSGESRSIMLNL
jgi:hypothetical protein